MFLANQIEMDVTLGTALIATTALFLAIALGLGGLCVWRQFPSEGLFTKIILLTLATIFVYENILFTLVPELDGQTRATTTPFLYAVDVGLLILVIWILLKSNRIQGRFVGALLLFFFTMTSLGLTTALIDDPPQTRERSDENFDRLPLSKDFNVIHILMDALQATEFDNALESLSDKNAYAGFTWFRNTVGVSYRTLFSKPAIFTGEIYTEASQFSEYYRPGRITFFDVVASNNYGIYSFDGPDPRRLKGTRVKDLTNSKPSTAENIGELFDIALIRIVPFFLKDLFLNDYEYFFAGFFRQDTPIGNEIHRAGLLKFADSLFIDSQDGVLPKYYFMHVLYPHAPYTHGEDCSYSGRALSLTAEQAKLEIHCAVKDFAYLLDRLRDLGIYENTLVVFHSDTVERYLIQADSLQGSSLPPRVAAGSPFALLAVKPVGTSQALKISEKPASLQDIPNTVLGQLGLPKSFDGVDLFELEDLAERERIYWAEKQGTFGVVGYVYDPKSWRKISDYKPQEVPEIKVGDRFSFSVFTPRGVEFFKKGWTSLLRDGIENIGPTSMMSLPVADVEGKEISKLTFHARFGANEALPTSYKLNGGATRPVHIVIPNPRKPSYFEFSIVVDGIPDSRELTLELHSAPVSDESDKSLNSSFRVVYLGVD